MTQDEVNRYIHEQIKGKCWGIGRWFGPTGCENCHESAHNHEHPDYCSDAYPRSLLNEVCDRVQETVGKLALEQAILDAIRGKSDRIASIPGGGVSLAAKYIAQGCVDAHRVSGQSKHVVTAAD